MVGRRTKKLLLTSSIIINLCQYVEFRSDVVTKYWYWGYFKKKQKNEYGLTATYVDLERLLFNGSGYYLCS
jgi:hypothetical protein